jgi:hypothetical protein
MSEKNDSILYDENGDMLVHEDKIESAGLLDVARLQNMEQLGYSLDEEGIETYEDMQRVTKAMDVIRQKVSPARVALAGIVVLLLLGVVASGWYWALPRDAVNVETQYLQRGGHLLMSEIHNTGSREITDVSLEVQFQSLDGEILDTMSIEVLRVEAHASVAGDDLEMMVIGHTVWANYILKVDLQYTDHKGTVQMQSWTHEVGDWTIEYFMDKADRSTWPVS